jgi:hypothetical protein
MSCPGPGPDLSAGVKPICYTAKPTSIWIPNSLRVQLLLPRKAAHLPVKGLMDLLGIDMARMVMRRRLPAFPPIKMTSYSTRSKYFRRLRFAGE